MPTLMAQYSDSNILQSLAVSLAANLLSSNYLVYWAALDMVQTQDGTYFAWSTNYATYLLDGTFNSRITAARGMVTLTEHRPAVPKWLLRPITAAGPIGQDELVLPVISIEVGPALPVRNLEIGSGSKWRFRHLIVEGYVRNRAEQRVFMDLLAGWFDNEVFFTIKDHDAGTLATVGDVECINTTGDYEIDPIAVEPVTYQVICNTRLQYIA